MHVTCSVGAVPAASERYRRRATCSARVRRARTAFSRRNIIDDPGTESAADTEPTVAQLGEFEVISRAVADRVQPPSTIVGPGDDAAVVAAPDGRIAASTDMLVHGRHFRLDWSSPVQIGRKAIAQNGADIAAMGARCSGFLVSLGCPADTPVRVTDGLNEGMWLEAVAAGSAIVGGDVVQSPELVISVTALGDLQGRAPVLRSGARVGDLIAYAGRLGWSAAGLALLLADADRTGHDAVLDAHRVPVPPYRAGVGAAEAGATSLTDVSDGLLSDLGHIADASNVRMNIDPELLDIPTELRSAATTMGVDALDWVLTGGEDHALVGTFGDHSAVPAEWTVIGRVEHVGDDRANRVTVDGRVHSGRSGWTSFESE
ncbi:thiamine-phosphate kinase [Rhodococcus sp. IEGM1428]|uniref:thiamine-phosphate kinase n=1 Tax=Rhodococcus sp. IEGM1428 TaxID=3392191 RepID=UPI003D14707C